MSIEFKRVTKSFGSRRVLEDVSLTVETGQVMFIIGTSGTGKSVLMKHVIGLLRPDSGEIRLDGRRVDELDEAGLYDVRRRCGFVFQNPALLDYLTLEENVAIPLRRHERLPRRAALERAREWLRRVGVDDRTARSLPTGLGAGVRKRAAIARALAAEPGYVVYDEPTTGLDPINARRIDSLIRNLSEHTQVTSIVVSHDLESIFSIADRIAFLYRGGLRLVGTPEAFRRSEDPVVRQFVNGEGEGPIVI